jgi:predicted nucleic acid-binding protein
MLRTAYLVDTNILLRLAQTRSPDHAKIRNCVDLLWANGANLFYTSQNLAEFWNVCTRPSDKNGLGVSMEETERRAIFIERQLMLVADSEATHRAWRKLVLAEKVSGTQVHDARLVAAMLIHAIPNILTLNGKDFRRFTGIRVVSPDDLLQLHP